MNKTIFCQKLQAEAPALPYAPLPGQLGQKIQSSISEPAWQQWVGHQTMLINENRLNVMDDSARDFLRQEMEKYLFGSGSAKPDGYVPPSK